MYGISYVLLNKLRSLPGQTDQTFSPTSDRMAKNSRDDRCHYSFEIIYFLENGNQCWISLSLLEGKVRSQPRAILKCNLGFSSQLYLDDDQPESLSSGPCLPECQVTRKVIKSTVPSPYIYIYCITHKKN